MGHTIDVISSPVFGESRELTDVEERVLEMIAEEAPVRVFQVLNKKLNSRGFAFTIGTIDDC